MIRKKRNWRGKTRFCCCRTGGLRLVSGGRKRTPARCRWLTVLGAKARIPPVTVARWPERSSGLLVNKHGRAAAGEAAPTPRIGANGWR